MQLSKFTNGDKKAIIVRKEYSYTIEYYLKDKVIKKEIVSDFTKAESLAEDYIMAEDGIGGATLLNENV